MTFKKTHNHFYTQKPHTVKQTSPKQVIFQKIIMACLAIEDFQEIIET